MPKYPEVVVTFSGADGNAFNLLGIVQRALRKAGVSDEEVQAFHAEATSGNYDNLLQVCMAWVEVE